MVFKRDPNIRRETQRFNDRNYHRYPDAKQKAHRTYFMRTGGRHLLHRDVWEHHHGPIPKGLDIHHVDGNPANNVIGNLEMVSRKQHLAEHHDARMAYALGPAQKAHLAEVRHLATEWHRSDEGRAWHRQNAKTSLHQPGGPKPYSKRPLVAAACRVCGAAYETKIPERRLYCSNTCACTAHRRRKGQSPRKP